MVMEPPPCSGRPCANKGSWRCLGFELVCHHSLVYVTFSEKHTMLIYPVSKTHPFHELRPSGDGAATLQRTAPCLGGRLALPWLLSL